MLHTALISTVALLTGATATEALNGLLDKRPQMRERALAVLRDDQAEREALVRQQLLVALKAPDRSYGGTTHTAIQAVMLLHAESALPDLLDSIDFTLDPSTFPVGGFQAVEESYPVAKTLRDMGGRGLIKRLLQSATRELTDSARNVHAWVLIEILGREAAEVVVEKAKPGLDPRRIQALEKLEDALREKVLLSPAEANPKHRPIPPPNRNRA